MHRVRSDQKWALFDPLDVPSLEGLSGDAFAEEYVRLERSVTPMCVMPAREIWLRVLEFQVETGGPFILYSDAINGKELTLIFSCGAV